MHNGIVVFKNLYGAFVKLYVRKHLLPNLKVYNILADPADFVLPKIDLSIGILKKEL